MSLTCFPAHELAANEWGGLYFSFHDTVANVGMADGSVRTLRTSTSLWIIGAMTTRSGGEVANLE